MPVFPLKRYQLLSQCFKTWYLAVKNDMEILYQEITKCVSFTHQHTMYINSYSSSNSNIQYMLSTTYHLYGYVVYLNMIHSSKCLLCQSNTYHIWMYDFSLSQTNNLKLKMSKQVLCSHSSSIPV